MNMCHKRIGFCMAVDAFNKRKTRIGQLGEPLPSPDRSVDADNSVELASSLHDGVSTSVTKKPSAARRAAVRVGTDQTKPEIPMPAHCLQRPLRNTASQGWNIDRVSLSWPGVRRPAATIQCSFDIASFAPADAAFISRRTRGNPNFAQMPLPFISKLESGAHIATIPAIQRILAVLDEDLLIGFERRFSTRDVAVVGDIDVASGVHHHPERLLESSGAVLLTPSLLRTPRAQLYGRDQRPRDEWLFNVDFRPSSVGTNGRQVGQIVQNRKLLARDVTVAR
jgi:hypothetical protein